MKYVSKKLPNSILELEVSLEQAEFLPYWEEEKKKALSQVHLKGFRPGSAPKEMAEQALDLDKVFHAATSNAIQDSLKDAVKEKDWQLIDQTRVEVLESDPLKSVGLKFKAILTVFPEVELGNYQKIAKRILKEKTPVVVKEEEVEKSIDWVRGSRAKTVLVDRPAKMGDVADIEFTGFLNGQPLDGASGKKDHFVLGEGHFVPGFEEQLAGHKAGEDLEFSIQFPDDYWKKDLQNQKVDFKAKINSVYDRQLPELNDGFAKTIGKFESVADLRKSVREGLQKEREEKESEGIRLRILEEISKEAKIDIPRVMIDRTLDGMVQEFRGLAKSLPKGASSEEELKKSLGEKARQNVITNLVLYKIAKIENLEPSSEEVEKEASQGLKNLDSKEAGKIDPQQLYDYTYGIVRNRKVLQYLESL